MLAIYWIGVAPGERVGIAKVVEPGDGLGNPRHRRGKRVAAGGMVQVDKAADAARPLGLGDRMQRKGRLSRRFRPVDLDDSAARQPANA